MRSHQTTLEIHSFQLDGQVCSLCATAACSSTAADLPYADETVVGIMAVTAQRQRELIAQRTRMPSRRSLAPV
jgi:hypothetical protein